MTQLFVYYEDKKVGTFFVDKEDVYSFLYEKSWLNDSEAFPLSFALPLSEQRYGNRITLSFFENLLPEGDVRHQIEKNNDIHGAYAFLKVFGMDCAGAIYLSPTEIIKKSPMGKRRELPFSKIEKAIEHHRPITDFLSSMERGYLSLAGAQEKFPAIYEDGKFYLPAEGEPTTHIVKLPIWRHGIKESVYNEYYCMTLAKKIGFKVPNFLIFKGTTPLYIIERYDRTHNSQGKIRRIHQQDLCQALGIPSSSKYEAEGGPSIKDDYELLRKSISTKYRFRDINAFFEWISFNLLIGNNDSHSKNISLLMRDGIQLAPFYDLICTEIYRDLKNKFSFSIADRNEADKIGKNQFNALNKELELKAGTFEGCFSKVMNAIDESYRSVGVEMRKEFPESKIAIRIEELISKRIKGFDILPPLKVFKLLRNF